jgi:hypothetical protein
LTRATIENRGLTPFTKRLNGEIFLVILLKHVSDWHTTNRALGKKRRSRAAANIAAAQTAAAAHFHLPHSHKKKHNLRPHFSHIFSRNFLHLYAKIAVCRHRERENGAVSQKDFVE